MHQVANTRFAAGSKNGLCSLQVGIEVFAFCAPDSRLASGVDHRVATLGGPGQRFVVGNAGAEDLGSTLLQFRRCTALQGHHFVTCIQQLAANGRAQKAATTGYQDLHYGGLRPCLRQVLTQYLRLGELTRGGFESRAVGASRMCNRRRKNSSVGRSLQDCCIFFAAHSASCSRWIFELWRISTGKPGWNRMVRTARVSG